MDPSLYPLSHSQRKSILKVSDYILVYVIMEGKGRKTLSMSREDINRREAGRKHMEELVNK